MDRGPKVQGIVSHVLVNTLALLFQPFVLFPFEGRCCHPAIVEKVRRAESLPGAWRRALRTRLGMNQLMVTVWSSSRACADPASQDAHRRVTDQSQSQGHIGEDSGSTVSSSNSSAKML